MKKILGNVANKSLDIVDQAVLDQDKKAEMVKGIIESELKSGSALVKFARPAIVYTGLLCILLEIFGIRPLILDTIEATDSALKSSEQILQYFFTVWGGVVGAYVLGRSYEKSNAKLFKKR